MTFETKPQPNMSYDNQKSLKPSQVERITITLKQFGVKFPFTPGSLVQKFLIDTAEIAEIKSAITSSRRCPRNQLIQLLTEKVRYYTENITFEFSETEDSDYKKLVPEAKILRE